MAYLYELAVLGAPSNAQVNELERIVSDAVKRFGFELGREVSWVVPPATSFRPSQDVGAAAVFFGSIALPDTNIEELRLRAIPVLPVVSDIAKVHEEIPPVLQPLNCLDYNAGGAQRVATALLECAGLLPRQRRVFLSYRRDEARQAALQLFDAFSARYFDVFLDTHGIAPGDDFQAMLWHRLCDSDVLVMLDTPTYFNSRWTAAEFGRAQAQSIPILQVLWPNFTPSPRTSSADRIHLIDSEVDTATGRIADDAVMRICMQLEVARSQSVAIRSLSLISRIEDEIKRIGGAITGIGPHKAVYLRLADDRDIVAYPTLGVPTSSALHDATMCHPSGNSVAVVYDHVGLHEQCLSHLKWLGEHIRVARWVGADEVAWQLADWEAR